MGSSREYLGAFEQVVLLALARLEDRGYGAEVHAEIVETSGRDASIPAVYVTLNRLETKGHVVSLVRPDPNGGGKRRVHPLEPEGHAALTQP